MSDPHLVWIKRQQTYVLGVLLYQTGTLESEPFSVGITVCYRFLDSFIYAYKCFSCTHVYVPHACLVTHGGQKRASNPLELELTNSLNHCGGTEPRSFERTSALNH